MSRFLVTGGGGFVGQWLARLLIQRGHETTLAGLGLVGDGPGDTERRRTQARSGGRRRRSKQGRRERDARRVAP